MGQQEAAQLFHKFLHRVGQIRDNPEIFDKTLKWIHDFLERDFTINFWIALIQELNLCQSLNCLNDIFAQLNKMDCQVFDARLADQFEDLFQRGLLEQIAETIPPPKIAEIFSKLFQNMFCLTRLFQRYYPFHNAKSVPSLGELTRWCVRKTLAEDEFMFLHLELPHHIVQILKFEREV